MVGLYGVLHATNILHSNKTEKSQVFYRHPMIGTGGFQDCRNHHQFEMLAVAMEVNVNHNVYHAFDKICYKNAVFGWIPMHVEAAKYVVQHIAFDIRTCQPNTVTIIQRKYRQILNIHELKIVSVNLGFNTNIVMFENMSAMEQYRIVRCTDILVGINGMGMEWAVFMRQGRAMLELSWKQFGFLFSKYAGHGGLHTAKLSAKRLYLNWNSFSQMCREGRNISESEKVAILGREIILRADNPYKWGDAEFDVSKFKVKLRQLATKVLINTEIR